MSDLWLDSELPSVEVIRQRLLQIIPDSLDTQGWARRELAAKTVFVLLYGYAVEGRGQWIRPTAVTDMTDAQAAQQQPEIRRDWLKTAQISKRPKSVVDRWFSENTREPIRDETLRLLVELGAVIERQGLSTTSPKPRYALAKDFAALFAPQLPTKELNLSIDQWRQTHLSKAALARLALLRKGVGGHSESVLIKLPNGETRRLSPGPSADLTRAVIEQLAPRFLGEAAVVMISQSAKKLGYEDRELSASIGFKIDVAGTLPDAVLVDLKASPPLVVFIECVATDGPVSERRKGELEALALASGFHSSDCAYVTVFHDRNLSPYRKMASSLAWGTFVWFETEPDQIIYLKKKTEAGTATLAQMLRASAS